MSFIDSHTPVIVGTAQWTQPRGQQPGAEPLLVWETVCRRAAADAGISDRTLSMVDMLSIANCMSWNYDDPVGRLAERLGASPKSRSYEHPSGTSGHAALSAAATAIRGGHADFSIICGGEMLATRKMYSLSGEVPPWSFPHSSARLFDLNQHQHPEEAAIGLFEGVGAVNSFAMRDIARRAHLGVDPQTYRQQLGELLAGMTEVAAKNPDAWFAQARSADFLITPRPDNRMIAYPYTKHMVAMLEVDIAAALIIMSEGRANQLGISQEKRVYPWTGCYAQDPVYIAVRDKLWKSDAMKAAATATLEAANISIDEVKYIDLYSCFASAINYSCDALGIDEVSGERVTITGGLPYAGGPASSYMYTSMNKLVERLRQDPGSYGMSSGVGMMMSNHAFGLYSTQPPEGIIHADQKLIQSQLNAIPQKRIDTHYEGAVTLAAYTVMHDRTGEISFGSAICDLPNGARAYARIFDKDLLREAEQSEMVGVKLNIYRKDFCAELG